MHRIKLKKKNAMGASVELIFRPAKLLVTSWVTERGNHGSVQWSVIY